MTDPKHPRARAQRGYQIDSLLELKTGEFGLVTAILTTKEGRRYQLHLVNTAEKREVSDEDVARQLREVLHRAPRTRKPEREARSSKQPNGRAEERARA